MFKIYTLLTTSASLMLASSTLLFDLLHNLTTTCDTISTMTATPNMKMAALVAEARMVVYEDSKK